MLRRLLLLVMLLSSALRLSAQSEAPAGRLGPYVAYDYQHGNHFLGGGIAHMQIIRQYSGLPTLVGLSHAAIGFRLGGPQPMLAPNIGMGLHWWLLCADVKGFYFTDFTDNTFGISVNGGMTIFSYVYGSCGYTFPLAVVDPLHVAGFHITAAFQVPIVRVAR